MHTITRAEQYVRPFISQQITSKMAQTSTKTSGLPNRAKSTNSTIISGTLSKNRLMKVLANHFRTSTRVSEGSPGLVEGYPHRSCTQRNREISHKNTVHCEQWGRPYKAISRLGNCSINIEMSFELFLLRMLCKCINTCLNLCFFPVIPKLSHIRIFSKKIDMNKAFFDSKSKAYLAVTFQFLL